MASIDIVQRLRFDAARCEAAFSKGVAGNIDEAADEIGRLRAALNQILAKATEPCDACYEIGEIARMAITNQQ